jgi:hypothetical protein
MKRRELLTWALHMGTLHIWWIGVWALISDTANATGNRLLYNEAIDTALWVNQKRGNPKYSDLFQQYDSFITTYTRDKLVFPDHIIELIRKLGIFPNSIFSSAGELDILNLTVDSIRKSGAPLTQFRARFPETFQKIIKTDIFSYLIIS